MLTLVLGIAGGVGIGVSSAVTVYGQLTNAERAINRASQRHAWKKQQKRAEKEQAQDITEEELFGDED